MKTRNNRVIKFILEFSQVLLRTKLNARPLRVGVGHKRNRRSGIIHKLFEETVYNLRTDATDRRMRQKLSLILIIIGLVCGGISYAFIPPKKYDNNLVKLTQARNSLVALTSWTTEDVFTWLKANFNERRVR